MPPSGILAAIGNTALVRLSRLAGGDRAEVWVKLEGANATGSYRGRTATNTVLVEVTEIHRMGGKPSVGVKRASAR